MITIRHQDTGIEWEVHECGRPSFVIDQAVKNDAIFEAWFAGKAWTPIRFKCREIPALKLVTNQRSTFFLNEEKISWVLYGATLLQIGDEWELVYDRAAVTQRI